VVEVRPSGGVTSTTLHLKKKYGTSYNKTMIYGFDVESTIIHTTFHVKKIGKKMKGTTFKMNQKVKKRSRLPLSTVIHKFLFTKNKLFCLGIGRKS
jgi:hypothetical protein